MRPWSKLYNYIDAMLLACAFIYLVYRHTPIELEADPE